ncbi:hypothetical protein BT93_K2438 [Corymbia citriodora subsp. variegata]|nr:hypothetical protein BT93_K2438 [Corymbia citriodora subsp. variegata]
MPRWRRFRGSLSGGSMASDPLFTKSPNLSKWVSGTGTYRWRGIAICTCACSLSSRGFLKNNRLSRDSLCVSRLLVLAVSCSLLKAGEATPVWLGDGSGLIQSVATQRTLHCLSRMLEEAIHSDITINTSDGSLRAHKAILSASSPVFQSMFRHNLKEKESSTIFIEDMSLESCTALLNYLYGCISQEDFWKHRLALLGAANKYGIADLKDACENSLLEDISSNNVLERLQEAWLYQLDKLKKGCLMLLFEFGKVYDVREEMNNFFRQADRELMLEMFQEVLTAWKPI